MNQYISNIWIILSSRTSQIIYALLAFITGGFIYLLFRTDELLMFQWAEKIKILDEILYFRTLTHNVTLAPWFVYSVPDGLWSISYILISNCIWKNEDIERRLFYACIIPVIGFASEFLQLIRILPGKFDVVDLLAYSLPYIIYVFILKTKKMRKIKFLITILVVGVFCLAATGSGSKSSDSSSHSIGDQVTITKDCFGAISEDAYDKMTKSCVAKDEVGIVNMMAAGLVRKIPAGSTGKLIDVGFMKEQVRMNDDQTAWYVAVEFVK